MTAISELEDLTLQQPYATRKVRNSPAGDGKHAVATASSLYQHLELDPLFEEFCVRLSQVAKVDEIRLQHESSARCLEKRIAAVTSTNQFLLRHRLEYQGESLGILSVTRHHQFLSAEIRQIRSFIDTLLGPLRNADQYLRVWRSAYEDSLTGVKNRASFDLLLSGQVPDISVSAMLVCDVDSFKSINDCYGHAAGDEVLRQFASQLQDCVGHRGEVYRYGGDEFVIALKAKLPDGGLQLAEDARGSASRLVLRTHNHEITFTTTIGLAQVRANESLDETFLRADGALLLGKKLSKNAVVQH